MSRKKQFYYTLFFMTFSLILINCQKEDEVNPVNTSQNKVFTNKIELKNMLLGDTIKLSWSKLDTIAFRGYIIIEKKIPNAVIDLDIFLKSAYNIYSNDSLHGFIAYSPDDTAFVVDRVPVSNYLEYQIIGILSNGGSYSYIYSNPITYERASVLNNFKIDPFDIITDFANDRIYLIETSKIHLLDLKSNKIIKSITTEAFQRNTYGTYNSEKKELYIPFANGDLNIYNADNLEQKNKISFGKSINQAFYINNNLLVCSDFEYYILNPDDYSIYKTVKNRLPGYDKAILMRGTNNTVFLAGEYYIFNADGILQSSESLVYSRSSDVIEFSNDNRKFIITDNGLIYNSDFQYLERLPQGKLLFADYEFSKDGSVLYCGCSNEKLIVSYSTIDFKEINRTKTQGYIYKMYLEDKTMKCLTHNYNQTDYLYLEQVEISK